MSLETKRHRQPAEGSSWKSDRVTERARDRETERQRDRETEHQRASDRVTEGTRARSTDGETNEPSEGRLFSILFLTKISAINKVHLK